MKLESPEFTDDDIAGFITDYFEKERSLLVGRLQKILEDTESMIPAIEGKNDSAGESWNPIETLAHMATTAQFFGWLAHEVATKKGVEGDITEMLRLRDVVVTDAAQLPPGALLKELQGHVEKTIDFLKTVDWDDLRTPINYVGRAMTGEDFVRIPLCGHLEGHIDQIKDALP